MIKTEFQELIKKGNAELLLTQLDRKEQFVLKTLTDTIGAKSTNEILSSYIIIAYNNNRKLHEKTTEVVNMKKINRMLYNERLKYMRKRLKEWHVQIPNYNTIEKILNNFNEWSLVNKREVTDRKEKFIWSVNPDVLIQLKKV